MKSYKPTVPISVIPAGKKWAVVVWKKIVVFGFLGWMLRSAADFVAFKDIEAWPQATQQWVHDFGEEEDCAICQRPW